MQKHLERGKWLLWFQLEPAHNEDNSFQRI